MKLRFAAIAVASLFLSGCSSFGFDDILGFPSGDADEAPTPMPAQTASAAVTAQPGSATVATSGAEAPSAFCRGVATQDANAGAFDAPTQAKVAQKSYAQCVAQFSAE